MPIPTLFARFTTPLRRDTRAQHSLGVMYHEGWGVPQEHAEAFRWYRKASGGGHVEAGRLVQEWDRRLAREWDRRLWEPK